MPRFQAPLLVILVSLSGMASAERWQVRVDNGQVKTRLDLDALQRDGDLLTYRMEISHPGIPERAGVRAVSTSVIDCRKNRRKHVASETYFPDGTVRKTVGANRWMTLKDWEFGAGVRNEYCGAAD